jgi:hypothetical protein
LNPVLRRILIFAWLCAVPEALSAAPRARPAPAPVASVPASAALTSTQVTATYQGTLIAHLMDVRTDYILEPTAYRAGARAKSSGAIDFVRPFSVLAQSNGALRGRSPSAGIAVIAGDRKRRIVDFRGKPIAFGADPLTQLLKIGLTDASPCIGPLIFFDGKQRYQMTFAPLGAGTLPDRQRMMGLSDPRTCRLSFQPISGVGAHSAKGSPLRGIAMAHFARLAAARIWVMTDVELPTIVGSGHIELSGLKVSYLRLPPLAR